MQKVILDTNVIVSALISQGFPSKILIELVFEQKVELQLSSQIFSEYIEVLMRPKFSKIPDFQMNAEIVIGRIEELSIKTQPSEKLSIIKDDMDNRFLELAMATRTNYLITGNTKDFTMGKIYDTSIVTPTIYWNNHRPNI